MPNHVISAADVPAEFEGRAVRCQQVDIVQVECIARGYLAGLGWDAYQETGMISGVQIPPGLREGTSFHGRCSRRRRRRHLRMGATSR
ncbi:hypothetical protein OG809_03325 [Kribbella soli]